MEQVPGDTSYRLGPRLATLAAGLTPARSLAAVAHADARSSWPPRPARPPGLSVPDGDLVHYIDQVDTPNPVSVRDWTGARVPLHAVSSGQVLLAFRPPAALERYLEHPLERFTPRTSRTRTRCASASARSVATAMPGSLEEFDEGITSVAAPIADATGEVVAAVHLHGPSYRFPADGGGRGDRRGVVGAAARIAPEPAPHVVAPWTWRACGPGGGRTRHDAHPTERYGRYRAPSRVAGGQASGGGRSSQTRTELPARMEAPHGPSGIGHSVQAAVVVPPGFGAGAGRHGRHAPARRPGGRSAQPGLAFIRSSRPTASCGHAANPRGPASRPRAHRGVLVGRSSSWRTTDAAHSPPACSS